MQSVIGFGPSFLLSTELFILSYLVIKYVHRITAINSWLQAIMSF